VEKCEEENNFEDLGIDGMVILKCVLKLKLILKK
jgi:hypothetical protein